MRLIDPKSDQDLFTIVFLKSPNEETSSFCLHKIPKHLNERTILLAQWSENYRKYIFWRILGL